MKGGDNQGTKTRAHTTKRAKLTAEQVQEFKDQVDKETVNDIGKYGPAALKAHKEGVMFDTTTPDGKTVQLDPLEYWIQKDVKNLHYLINPNNKIKINKKAPIVFFLEKGTTLPAIEVESREYAGLEEKVSQTQEEQSIIGAIVEDEEFSISIGGKGMSGKEYMNYIRGQHRAVYDKYQDDIIKARAEKAKQAEEPAVNATTSSTEAAPEAAPETTPEAAPEAAKAPQPDVANETKFSTKVDPEQIDLTTEATSRPASVKAEMKPEGLDLDPELSKQFDDLARGLGAGFVPDNTAFDEMGEELNQDNRNAAELQADQQKAAAAQKPKDEKTVEEQIAEFSPFDDAPFKEVDAAKKARDSQEIDERLEKAAEDLEPKLDPKTQEAIRKSVMQAKQTVDAAKQVLDPKAKSEDKDQAKEKTKGKFAKVMSQLLDKFKPSKNKGSKDEDKSTDVKDDKKQETGEKVDKDSKLKDLKQDIAKKSLKYNESIKKNVGELKSDLREYKAESKDKKWGAAKSGAATVGLVMVAFVFPPAAPIALAGAVVAGVLTAIRGAAGLRASAKADKAERDIMRQQNDANQGAQEPQKEQTKEQEKPKEQEQKRETSQTKDEPEKPKEPKGKEEQGKDEKQGQQKSEWVRAEKPNAEGVKIGSRGTDAAATLAEATKGGVKSTDKSSKTPNTPDQPGKGVGKGDGGRSA